MLGYIFYINFGMQFWPWWSDIFFAVTARKSPSPKYKAWALPEPSVFRPDPALLVLPVCMYVHMYVYMCTHSWGFSFPKVNVTITIFCDFLPIFCEKLAFFSKTIAMIIFFAKSSSSLNKKRRYFSPKVFQKIVTSVPSFEMWAWSTSRRYQAFMGKIQEFRAKKFRSGKSFILSEHH
jgi:hypothetical protein